MNAGLATLGVAAVLALGACGGKELTAAKPPPAATTSTTSTSTDWTTDQRIVFEGDFVVPSATMTAAQRACNVQWIEANQTFADAETALRMPADFAGTTACSDTR
jgi:hypothetical protein